VLNISIAEPKATSVPEPAVEAVASANPFPGLNPNAPAPAPMTPKAVPKKMEVKLSVIGDYANIKNLLEKIQKVKRFNRISALEIKTLLKEDQTVSESLQTNVTLEFNYLKELKKLANGDIANAIFSTGVFDKKVAEKIRASRSIEVNSVIPGERGGSNPFIIAKFFSSISALSSFSNIFFVFFFLFSFSMCLGVYVFINKFTI